MEHIDGTRMRYGLNITTVAAVGSPRIDQINVVVSDVSAASRFLTGLGVELPATPPEWAVWDAHHVTVPATTSLDVGHDLAEPTFGIDLDSTAFAQQWGGLKPSFNGVVLNLRVDERSEVDRLHEEALSIGGRSLTAPYDAFWGSRYAVVEGPGPLIVGLMSQADQDRRTPPPDPTTFT